VRCRGTHGQGVGEEVCDGQCGEAVVEPAASQANSNSPSHADIC
jgi:hypothetical protein